MHNSDNEEFYIGYAPRPPRRIARTIFRAVVGLNALAATVALALLLVGAGTGQAASPSRVCPLPTMLRRSGRADKMPQARLACQVKTNRENPLISHEIPAVRPSPA